MVCIIVNEDKKVILNNIADITAGYPFRGKISEQLGSSIYAVQMKNVFSESGIDWLTCVETELAGKRSPAWLKKGDVLVAARGNSNYAVLVDEAVTKLKAVASPHFYVLSVKNDKVLSDYLCWFINSQPAQRYFQRESEGTFTKSIRRQVLETLPVALPSLEKQQNIVQLSATIWRERQLYEQLIRNDEVLMNAIANDLLQETQSFQYKEKV